MNDKLCDLYDEALRRAGDDWAERTKKIATFREAFVNPTTTVYMTTTAHGTRYLEFDFAKLLAYIGDRSNRVVSVFAQSNIKNDFGTYHYPDDDWATLRKSSTH